MKNKKVLITGAGGFIGSNLAEHCVEKGWRVKAFVRYNSNNSWGWLETSRYKNEIEVVSGDMRDYDSVSSAIKGCDAVFHLAALIGIPYSYRSPLAYIKTNIEGTYNLLQSARKYTLESILITSTSEVYGTAQYVPIDEQHPVVGQSPYSASKIAADQLAISFHRSFDLPVKIVRPFNTYGPRQSARAIIPTVITQICAGKKDLKLGNTSPTRDLTYVMDTARGFLAVAKEKAFIGQVTNIGNNEEITIGNLVKLIAELMGVQINIITAEERVRPKQSEVERLWCDNKKLIKNTGWTPKYDLRNGLKKTIRWIEKNMVYFKPDQYVK